MIALRQFGDAVDGGLDALGVIIVAWLGFETFDDIRERQRDAAVAIAGQGEIGDDVAEVVGGVLEAGVAEGDWRRLSDRRGDEDEQGCDDRGPVHFGLTVGVVRVLWDRVRITEAWVESRKKEFSERRAEA